MSQSTAPGNYSNGWVPGSRWGTRLATVRQVMGWNLSEAAEACGTNHQSWANWEDGKKCRDQEGMAAKITEATGVSYIWLLTGQEPPGVEVRSRCFSPRPALAVIEGQNYAETTGAGRGKQHLSVVR